MQDIPKRFKEQLNDETLTTRMDQLRPFYMPDAGIRTEDELFSIADELMADIEREKRAREWLLAEVLWSFIDNIPERERKSNDRYKNEDYIVRHYCRRFAERYGGSFSTYYHRMRGYAIKRERGYESLDTDAVSASMVYRVSNMANGDRREEEETLRRLDRGEMGTKDVEEVAYLRNQGHANAPAGRYEFYVIPEASEIYWRVDDGQLRPCTYPSEGWSLLVKRLGAKPLDKVVAQNGNLGREALPERLKT